MITNLNGLDYTGYFMLGTTGPSCIPSCKFALAFKLILVDPGIDDPEGGQFACCARAAGAGAALALNGRSSLIVDSICVTGQATSVSDSRRLSRSQ